MKANELRVGNIVFENVKSNNITCVQVSTIKEIHDESVLLKHGLNPQLDNIEPIKITSEWLINLGFEFYGFDKFQYLIYALSNVIDGTSDFRVTGLGGKWYAQIDDSVCSWADLKYVHQLQNLYYAITGNELELVNSEKKY